MTATEISNIVNNGNDLSTMSYNDFLGHVGIMICHAFLHDIPMDVDVLTRYLKMEKSDVETALSRLQSAGILVSYGWLIKNKNSMMRMSGKSYEESLAAWTHIAAISSGYIESLPNNRYIAASSLYKHIINS
jgi:hypothetical protein